LFSFQTYDQNYEVLPYIISKIFLFTFTHNIQYMASRFVKPVNALVSGYSFLHSTMSGKPLIYGMPAAISVEITNHCNLQCPECVSGSGLMKREKGFMDIKLFSKIVHELNPFLYNINLYFQGEPMMHPEFFSFLDHSGISATTVSTNGHFLTEENSEKLISSDLKKLIVSLDGMDQKVYSEYRRKGDFNKVVAGVENVLAAKSRFRSSMKLEIQFLVNRYNEHQIGQAKQFARERGVSLKLKSMQVIDCGSAGDWMPLDRKYRRYIKRNKGYVIKSTLPDRCFRLWFNPVITWDGKVLPCCFDKDADYIMGDLNLNSFREIWHGSAYTEFRQSVLAGRNKIGMCRNCTAGLKGVRL
jgi:radical SAM protein with 4Fe4S-binding SPASM domain